MKKTNPLGIIHKLKTFFKQGAKKCFPVSVWTSFTDLLVGDYTPKHCRTSLEYDNLFMILDMYRVVMDMYYIFYSLSVMIGSKKS